MRINHNISALQTNAHMRRTGNALDKAMEKLASGFKINKAADDAAGMAISRKMKTQIEGLERASMNGSDGISAIQTAEGALNEVSAILQRCRQLAVQAANDTNTGDDRGAIQDEINQLLQEIDRISDSTEFNTKNLLNGDLANNSYSDNLKTELIYSSDTVPVGNYSFNVTMDPRQAVIKCDAAFGSISKEEAGSITINGVSVAFKEDDDVEDWFSRLRDTCDRIGINVFFGDGPMDGAPIETAGYDKNDAGSSLIFMSRGYGVSQKINIKCENSYLGNALGILADPDDGITAYGVDAEIDLGDGFSKSATTSSNGQIVTVKDSDGFEMKYRIEPKASQTTFVDASGNGSIAASAVPGPVTKVNSTLLAAGSLYLQVGANEDQTIEVKIPKVDTETLEIRDVNVCTHESAQEAIAAFDKAIGFVSSVRSKLGAYQNRLEHTVTNIDTEGYNITEALSRIADADMAEEMTAFTQQNVLQQAGTAMLAQANERPQSILSLLNG